jgi:phospholipid/cholesterol/gamma-HCH transport system substrate-binding protein
MIAILAVIILGMTGVWLRGQRPKITGVPYHIIFDRVEGLTAGAPVRLAGVQIGHVYELTILANRKVDVEIDVMPAYEQYTLTKESVYTIGQSFVGERWLEIGPQPGEPLPSGGTANGVSPVTLDELLAKSEGTLDTVDASMVGFNKLVNDPEFQHNIKSSVGSLQKLASSFQHTAGDASRLINNLNNSVSSLTGSASNMMSSITGQVSSLASDAHGLMGNVNQIVVTNKDSIAGILRNVKQGTRSLQVAMDSLNKQLNNKAVTENLQATVANVRKVTEDLDSVLSDVHLIASDPKVQSSIKGTFEEAHDTVVQAREAMEKVNHILGKFGGGGATSEKSKLFEMDTESEYNFRTGGVSANLNGWILPEGIGPVPYGVKAGVDSFGSQNLLNFEVGKTSSDTFRSRAGVIRSRLGVGFDSFLSNKSMFSFDLYDPANLQLDMMGRFGLSKDIYVLGGVRDTLHDRAPVMGIGKQF